MASTEIDSSGPAGAVHLWLEENHARLHASRPQDLLLASLAGLGCAGRRPPTIVGGGAGRPRRLPRRPPAAAGQPLRADEIPCAPGASHHLVQVRSAESPHRHHVHDLAVFVLRGERMLRLDGTPAPLHTGDAAVVPSRSEPLVAGRGTRPPSRWWCPRRYWTRRTRFPAPLTPFRGASRLRGRNRSTKEEACDDEQ